MDVMKLLAALPTNQPMIGANVSVNPNNEPVFSAAIIVGRFMETPLLTETAKASAETLRARRVVEITVIRVV